MLELLEEELAASKADVVRLGLAALRRDPDLRRQLRAERAAAGLLTRLRAQHGPHAQLQVELASANTDGPVPATWLISRLGRSVPVDSADLVVFVRRENETYFIDLVDPQSGAGIRGAWWGLKANVTFPLAAVNFWRTMPLTEAVTVTLPDGRTAVEVEREDGTPVRYILGPEGTSPLIHEAQRAQWFFGGTEESA